MTVIQSDSRLEAAAMHLTRKLSGCDDGTCPAVWDTDDPELVAVQGTVLTDPQALADLGQVPAHEQVVLLPREILDGYRRSGL
jgi:hypothetical protein